MNALQKFIRRLRKTQRRGYQSSFQGGAINSSPEYWVSNSSNSTDTGDVSLIPASEGSIKRINNKDERLNRKPAEIFQEIISEVPKMNLINLDKQIKLVKRRKDFFEYEFNFNSIDEKLALSYLRARKKYLKYAQLFRWSITTQEKINKLCKKYKVRMVSFEGYYKNIPMEAIDELEHYIRAHKKVTRAKPLFHLIIDDGGKEDKKDPILLVSSPFGCWFYILGAWDKEVEIVDDLVYKGK